MNWKTTLVLLVVAGAGTGGYLLREELPQWLKPGSSQPASSNTSTLEVLQKLGSAKIKSITVEKKGEEQVRLHRTAGGSWSLPGNWPMRKDKAQRLVDIVTGLHTRFAPLTLKEEELSRYGLQPPDVVVTVETESGKHNLAFGEGPRANEGNDFFRPTYMRVDRNTDLVRLGPGLVAALDQPREHYMRLRVFPEGKRVLKDKETLERVEQLKGTALKVQGPKEGEEEVAYTLVLDPEKDSWLLSKPLKDRLDPDKRDAILEAIPDLYVDRFVSTSQLRSLHATAAVGASALGTGLVALPSLSEEGRKQWQLARCGLAKPERVIEVETDQGTTQLLIGSVAETRQRIEQRPGPMGRMMPFPVREEYRFAKLKENDQIFTLKAEKLDPIFVTAGSLRDSRLVRFETDNVVKVEVQRSGNPPLVLHKEEKDWKVKLNAGDPEKAKTIDAEQRKVNELLDELNTIEASGADILDQAKAGEVGLDKPMATIVVTTEEVKEDKTKETKTFTFRVGKHDEKDKKLMVQVEGWDRVNRARDDLVKLVKRPALAYRGSLFDIETDKLKQIAIDQKGKKLTLARKEDAWKLTAPVETAVSDTKAVQLADQLKVAEPVDFITDKPSMEDLDKLYGLAKPSYTVTVESEESKRTLLVGNKRGEKAEYFAKFQSEPEVFVINEDLFGELEKDSLSYLSEDLWSIPLENISAVQGRKSSEEPYLLKKAEDQWQLTEPFDAKKLQGGGAEALVEALAAPKSERYVSHGTKELAEYGLDKPSLQFTVRSSKAEEKSKTILIGKQTKEGTGRYAKMAMEEAIFVVSDDLLKKVDKGALELLDPTLVTLEGGGYLQGIESKQGEATFSVGRKDQDAEWQVTGAPGSPFTADENATSSLQSVTFKMEADRFVAYGDKVDWTKYGLDKPGITVTLNLMRGAEGEPSKKEARVIAIGKPLEEDTEKRYARVGNAPGVLVLTGEQAKVLSRSHLDYVNHQFLSFDSTGLTSVERTGNKKLTLTKKDSQWLITAPGMHQADAESMQNLVQDLGDLRASDIVAYPVKELKTYGLDEPSTVITVERMEEGKPVKHVLKLGSAPEGKIGTRYAIVEGSKAVGVLPDHVATRLLAEPLAFRNRSLASFENPNHLLFERGPRRGTLSKKDDNWKITAPVDADADDARLGTLIDTFSRLRAEELVAEKSMELAMYGLEKPLARWKFQQDGKLLLDVLVGKRDKSGKRAYAKLAGQDVVFLLSADATQQVFEEYREKEIWESPLDASTVTQLQLTRDGKAVTVDKKDNLWRLGTEDLANQDAVNEVVGAMANLKAVRYELDMEASLALYGLNGTGQAQLIATTDSGKHTLILGGYAGNGKQRYARVSSKGRPGIFVISKEDAEKLVRDPASLKQP